MTNIFEKEKEKLSKLYYNKSYAELTHEEQWRITFLTEEELYMGK